MNVTDAIVLLRGDPLRHLVGLEMLTLYGDQAELKFARGAEGWALRATLPIHVTEFDRKNYPELDDAFQHGARAFAVRRQGRVTSACFVYPNFETIWEVAGVFTQPEYRGQGHAKSVVSAALRYLATANRQARYQTTADNTASLRLASSLGLEEFLRVAHVAIAS